MMRSNFLLRLFAYRERPARAPVEDFLTEAFCAFLQALSERGHGHLVKELLALKFVPDRHFTWSSQTAIDAGRPDILGTGKCQAAKEWTVIVENKIWAGFTGSDAESDHQLHRYWNYLQNAGRDAAQLILITHGTLPPAGFRGEKIHWSEVGAKLTRWRSEGHLTEGGMLHSAACWLEVFLKEHNMQEIKLDLITIGCQPYWERLKNACGDLGQEAGQFSRDLLETRLAGKFCPPKKNKLPDELWGHCLVSVAEKNAGVPLWNAKLMIWSGVRIGTPWEVSCQIEGTPEYFVAITAWEPDDEPPLTPLQLIDSFRRIAGLANWELVEDDGGTASLCRREPLTAKYHPLLDLRAHARNFFRESFEQLRLVPDDAWQCLSSWAGEIYAETAAS